MLNVYHIEKNNHVNGQGKRYVIWLQGCHLACSDCWNKQTWSFKKKQIMSVETLFEDIIQQDALDGVTFSGGEPFLQASLLSELATLIKNDTALDIHIFTGFELEELTDPFQIKLKDLADTIVSGRFDKSKKQNNQKVHTKLSIESAWAFNNTDVEIDLNEYGDLIVTGYPTKMLLASLGQGKNIERI